MKLIFLIAFTSVASLLFFSCKHSTDLTGIPEVHFLNDIQPIIISNCTEAGCHSVTGSGEEVFSLVTYDDVKREVKARDASNSRLYESITGNTEHLMPPPSHPSLSDKQIKLIYIWIEQGAKNN